MKTKITILKGNDPRHDYFAWLLTQSIKADYQIISFKRLGYKRLLKMLKRSPRTFFSRLSKYIFYFFIRWTSREKRYFNVPKLSNEIKVESFNSQTTNRMIESFSPSIIIAFGVPIISEKIISHAKIAALNLHGGISPFYKGGNTIFWALYNNDIQQVGATIHYMTKSVDSGDILAYIYPDITKKDDEFSISAKTFKYATEAMIKIVSDLSSAEAKLKGKIQVEEGKLYLARDRTLLKNMTGLIKIKRNLKNVERELKVEYHYE